MKKETCVLVIGGSDSSGGAGVSRDIATIASFGLRSAVALTAITVQTHEAVHHVEPVEPSVIVDQIRAALSANRVQAVKIGLVATLPAITAVSAALRSHPETPVVLDPVLMASSGGWLTRADVAQALLTELVPYISLVTPNLAELAALSGRPVVSDEGAILEQGRRLLNAGAAAMLAKGGHGTGASSTDYLLCPDQPAIPFHAPRIDAAMRGTGCMLASAIAAGLASDQTLETSIRTAKEFVHSHLRSIARLSALTDRKLLRA